MSDMSDAEFGRHLLARPKPRPKMRLRDAEEELHRLRDRAEIAETRARLLEEELSKAHRRVNQLRGVISVMRKHIGDASEAKAASHETGQDQPQ